jgi:hypothetical protein
LRAIVGAAVKRPGGPGVKKGAAVKGFAALFDNPPWLLKGP